MINNLLVPGGLGFIGSHTVVELFTGTSTNMIIVDDMSNCFDDVYDRIKQILKQEGKTEQEISARIQIENFSIMNLEKLDQLFKKQIQIGKPIDGIMHFAAKKAIGQSMKEPIMYYENNILGSLNLFKMMEKHGCKNFIFSSTAGVYGDKDNCKQTDELRPGSPYGQSKMAVELLLQSLANVHKDWKIISLRYFNPCGGHKSALLGDEPLGYPNNLFPFIQEVLVGKKEKLVVFGSDYPTPDGTCVRDYIHIYDLAIAHVLAFQHLDKNQKTYQVYNVGSGSGYSVLQILKGFEKVLKEPVKYEMGARRAGDIPKLTANTQKSMNVLGWKITKNLTQMCYDACRFIFNRFKIEKEITKVE